MVTSGEFGRLNYHEWGEGPALVLLHGFAPGVDALTEFNHHIPSFAQHFRVIAVDLPSFGLSDSHHGGTYYPAYAAASLIALLDGLGVESAHIVGVSLGAWVAMQVALSAQHRIGRLVLVGPGGLFSENVTTPSSEGVRRLVGFMNRPSTSGMLAWLETQFSDPNRISDGLVDASIDRAVNNGAIERLRTVMDNFSAHGDEMSLWAQAHKVKSPTLVVWGRDDRVLPLEGALFGTRRFPQGDMHVFANCGHRVLMERGEEFEELALQFLGG